MTHQLVGAKRAIDGDAQHESPRKKVSAHPPQNHTVHFEDDSHIATNTQSFDDRTVDELTACSLYAFTNTNLAPELRPWGDALCAAATPPCTDPNCDEVLPCPEATDWCQFSSECLGDICYDEQCLPIDQGHDLCCTEPCPDKSRCVSPCYGQVCTFDACTGPPAVTTATYNTDHVINWRDHRHHHFPQNSHYGDPCECIDPNCLRRSDGSGLPPYSDDFPSNNHHHPSTFHTIQTHRPSDHKIHEPGSEHPRPTCFTRDSHGPLHYHANYQTPPYSQMPYSVAPSWNTDIERSITAAPFEMVPLLSSVPASNRPRPFRAQHQCSCRVH